MFLSIFRSRHFGVSVDSVKNSLNSVEQQHSADSDFLETRLNKSVKPENPQRHTFFDQQAERPSTKANKTG
jgi:hypothetical protein